MVIQLLFFRCCFQDLFKTASVNIQLYLTEICHSIKINSLKIIQFTFNTQESHPDFTMSHKAGTCELSDSKKWHIFAWLKHIYNCISVNSLPYLIYYLLKIGLVWFICLMTHQLLIGHLMLKFDLFVTITIINLQTSSLAQWVECLPMVRKTWVQYQVVSY